VNDDTDYLDWSLVEAIDEARELLDRIRADLVHPEATDLSRDLPEP
jgi:hypothetical protein